MFRNSFFGNNFAVRSAPNRIPEAPPVPEEPLENMPRSNLVCEICGRVFRTHSELDRHMENMHGQPEKTHIRSHTE
ncbi:MAG: C2H2-type zinc finger protein [Candidatus Bathyarchaeia archaeon]